MKHFLVFMFICIIASCTDPVPCNEQQSYQNGYTRGYQDGYAAGIPKDTVVVKKVKSDKRPMWPQ